MGGVTVISGGTATNELVSFFDSLHLPVSYILPISDNGGSTSEIIRVVGGPAIGDIRSRLTRLIPASQENLQKLLSFRLSADPVNAKREWNEIVEGVHPLWTNINPATKEIIRAYLIYVHTELLRRSRQSANKQFRYELANVGNLFLTGVRSFVGSLDSAIELFARITNIDPKTEVIPCLNTNFTYHISAVLKNGHVITGQSQISHPSESESYPPVIKKTRPGSPVSVVTPVIGVDDNDIPQYQHLDSISPGSNTPCQSDFENSEDEEEGNEYEGGVPQYTHPELRKSQLHFNKSENIAPLMSPIDRIFYISPYGEEILPTANNRVCLNLNQAEVIIYSIGSLMTSIVPVLILKGTGKSILSNPNKKKIFLLNGSYDRETDGMNAVWFVETIVKSALYSFGKNQPKKYSWSDFVTHLIHLENSTIPIERETLNSHGIKCISVKRSGESQYYDLEALGDTIREVIQE